MDGEERAARGAETGPHDAVSTGRRSRRLPSLPETIARGGRRTRRIPAAHRGARLGRGVNPGAARRSCGGPHGILTR